MLIAESNRYLDITAEQRKKLIGPTMGVKDSALEYAFKRNSNCFACPHVCHSFLTPTSGPVGEAWCAPILDTGLWAGQADRGMTPVTTPFGDIVDDGPAVFDDKALFFGKMLDLMGINTFNVGGLGHTRVGTWAVTCYQLGIFTEKVTSPIDLSKIGTREFSVTFTTAVAHRKGKFATLIGEGAVRAAAYIRDHPEELGLTKEQAEKQWEVCERAYPAHGMLMHHFYRDEPLLSPKFRQAPLCALVWAVSSRDPFAALHGAFYMYDDQSHGNSRGHAGAIYFDEDAGCRYLDAEGRPILTNQLGQPEEGKWYDYQNVEKRQTNRIIMG